jgi:hypothetical protein
MQDFYILQRTEQPLTAEQVKKWYYTVEMLGPENILAGDDDTSSLMLGMQYGSYLYIFPLVRHLSVKEAERIVEGYMRVTEHNFEIETSNIYRADVDFGHPFEYDIEMDENARDTIYAAMARRNHNRWIQEKQQAGWRFGLNLDLIEKTHPAMRPWDDLPKSYQQRAMIEDRELLEYYVKNQNDF